MARTRRQAANSADHQHEESKMTTRTPRNEPPMDRTEDKDSAEPATTKERKFSNADSLLKEATGKAVTITQKENQSCPLLELPAELRNYIWELALGGEEVHIWNKFSYGTGVYKWYRAACSGPKRLQDQADECKAASDNSSTTWEFRYWDKSQSARTNSGLALLRTCRQIYAEAALLPFALNTFFFERDEVLFAFLHRVTKKQARSIQHLAVLLPNVKRYCNRLCPEAFKEYQEHFKNRLQALDSLILFVPLDHEGYTEIATETATLFKLLQIEKVTLAAYVDLEYDDPNENEKQEATLLKTKLNMWADEMEQELKKDWVTIKEGDKMGAEGEGKK